MQGLAGQKRHWSASMGNTGVASCTVEKNFSSNEQLFAESCILLTNE
jgi:hypothetical protein